MRSLVLWVALTLLFTTACGSKKVQQAEVPEVPETSATAAEGIELKAQALFRTTLSTEAPWSYAGETGPDRWGQLHPTYELCMNGKRQSPVDLVFKKPNEIQEIIFDLRDSIWTLMDRDPFFVVQPGRTNSTYFSGTSFILKELTLHTPAEHTFSGKRHPLEVSLYHESENGETLIVSTFFAEGAADNPAINQILHHIPLADQKDFQVIEPLALGLLLPEVRSYYHYMGSLTYPPCTEGIHRVAFNTPLEISSAQLAQLKALLPQNSRPKQPLHERPVENFPTIPGASN